MFDVFKSRLGLTTGAAVVVLCILAFFLVTAPNWHSLLGQPPAPPKPEAPVASSANPSVAPPAEQAAKPAPAQAPDAAAPSGSSAPPAPAPPARPAPDQAAAVPPPSPPVAPQGSAASVPAASTPGKSAPPVPESSLAGGSAPSNDGQAAPDGSAPKATTPALPVTPGTAAQVSPAPETGAAQSSQPAPKAGEPADAAPPAGAASVTQVTPVVAPTAPTFDIVRVEPTGDSVVAARGAPDSDVVLLDNGAEIARGKADAGGQVALIPPALKPGEHNLVLSMIPPGAKAVASSQSVAVSVPEQPRTAPMVALIQPNQPAAILSGPVAGNAVVPGGSAEGQPATVDSTKPSEPLAIRTVEAESMGSFYATGKAPSGSTSRVYLNGSFVASVTADQKGLWSLKINKGMTPGHYAVRADQLDKAGQVVARAEVPFDYPARVASADTASAGSKKNTSDNRSDSPVTAGTTVESPSVIGSTNPLPSAAAPSASSPGSETQPTTGGAGGEGRQGPTAGAPAVSGEATFGAEPHPAAPAGKPTPEGSVNRQVAGAEAPGGDAAATGGKTGSPPRDEVAMQPAPGAGQSAPAGTASSASSASTAGAGSKVDGLLQGGAKLQAPTAGVTDAPAASASPGSAASNPEPQRGPTAPAQPAPAQGRSASNEVSPAQAAKASPSSQGPSTHAADESDSPTVIAELITAKVSRGDSLWRISRDMLGRGIRYTQIYAANTQQIRDPRLIYPGQVFVVPQD